MAIKKEKLREFLDSLEDGDTLHIVNDCDWNEYRLRSTNNPDEEITICTEAESDRN